MGFFFFPGHFDINGSSFASFRMTALTYSSVHIPRLVSLFGNVLIWPSYITGSLVSRANAKSLEGALETAEVGFRILMQILSLQEPCTAWIPEPHAHDFPMWLCLFQLSKYRAALNICRIWNICYVAEGIPLRMWQVRISTLWGRGDSDSCDFTGNLKKKQRRWMSQSLRSVSHQCKTKAIN